MVYSTANSTPTASATTPGTGGALIDVLVVVLVSACAFAAELAARDLLPWGAEARGVGAVLAGAIAAVTLTLYRGGTLSDLGFRRPSRWQTAPLWAIAILLVFIVAQALVPAVIAQFVDLPAPDMSRYDAVRGDLANALLLAILLPLFAAVPEEVVYRGFLMDRLSRLAGGGRVGAIAAVVAQALIFGSVHFQWGIGGVLFATIMGLVWGVGFLLSGRNLWIVIIAHALAHLALVIQLYGS